MNGRMRRSRLRISPKRFVVPQKILLIYSLPCLIIVVLQSLICKLQTFIVSWNPVSGRRNLRRHRESSTLRRVDASSGLELWKAGPADIYTGPAQKAMYLLKENPMLFDATVEEELEALSLQREEDELRNSSIEANFKEDALILRQRIDEVRAAERERVTTELLYLKVCKRFKDLQVPLIPPLKHGGFIRFGAVDLKGLTTDIYSKDALDLVREHLFSIIGHDSNNSFMGGFNTVQIALIQASQVYAMSSLFGYYLRRMDARYQLEKLAGSLGAWGDEASELKSVSFVGDHDADSLKAYISNFGQIEMMKMTSVASREAQAALERQVAALFGDIRVLQQRLQDVLGLVGSPAEANMKLQQALDNGQIESIHLTGDDVRRMVLEAVAFGAVLTDSEKQVETIYELTPKRPFGSDIGRMDGGDVGRFLPD